MRAIQYGKNTKLGFSLNEVFVTFLFLSKDSFRRTVCCLFKPLYNFKLKLKYSSSRTEQVADTGQDKI